MSIGVNMSEPHDLVSQVQSALDDVDQLRPTEELAVYEQVLSQLTALLNAPEDHGPGVV